MSCIFPINRLNETPMDTTKTEPQRMRSPLPEEIATVYTEETELHWRRIISAILAVLAALTMVGWILMNSISAEQAAEVISAKPTIEESETGVQREAVADAESEPRILQLEEAIPAIPAVPAAPAPAEPLAVEPAEPAPAEPAPTTTADSPSAPPQSAVPPLLEEVAPLEANVPETPASLLPPETAPDEFMDDPVDTSLAQVTRNPQYVSSLQLTSGLQNKNPTDVLDAQIMLGDRTLVKIYAYSELTNLKGEKVFHEWYLGDKRMARVPVGVYLNDMRASSSKYIDRTMAGDWRLEITRANGEKLGRMDFRVHAGS